MVSKGDLRRTSLTPRGGAKLECILPLAKGRETIGKTGKFESKAMESELSGRRFSQTNLLDLLIPLAQRKWFIAFLASGFGLSAAIVSLLLPVRFTATTTILPKRPSVEYGTSTQSSLFSTSSRSSLKSFDPNDMYAEMMRSQSVEDALIHQFKLKDRYRVSSDTEAREALEEHCNIENAQFDGGLIRISFTDSNPQLAAELANTYVRNFTQLNADIAGSGARKRRVFLETRIAAIKEDLLGAEEALRKAQIAHGLVQVNSQLRSLFESSARIRAQISAKQTQIQAIRSFASGENPELGAAEHELSAWQTQLSLIENESSEGEMQFSRLSAPGASLEYARRLRDIEYFLAILQIIEPEYEFAKLDEIRQGSPVAVVERAVPPDRRSYPKRTMIVLVAGTAGFILGVFLVLLEAGIEDERLPGGKNLQCLLDSIGIVHSHRRSSAAD